MSKQLQVFFLAILAFLPVYGCSQKEAGNENRQNPSPTSSVKQNNPSHETPEKWSASYASANADGLFEENVIVVPTKTVFHALRWTIATCESCDSKDARKSYVFNLPIASNSSNWEDLVKNLGLSANGQTLVDKEKGPSGEDIEFSLEEKFVIKPSFNCLKVSGSREKAICSSPLLSLQDLELAITYDAASKCGDVKQLKKSQDSWWRETLSRCNDAACVPEIYSARIEELRRICKN